MQAYVPAPMLSDINLRADRSDWKMRGTCPACVGTRIKPFARIRHFQYDRCRDCGFVFANPAPSEKATSDFYNSDFYGNYRALEEERIRQQPYFSISAYRDPRLLANWLTCNRSARILDIGCGPASFIAMLRDEYGFSDVEGLELNETSAGVAERSYHIKLTPTVQQLRHPAYDIIILFEVIEHLPDPAEMIVLCRDLLAPEGRLFITTPSVRNIPGRFFPSYCGHYTGPGHVSLFTEEAMRRLLSRFGFGVARLETDAAPLLGHAVTSPLYNLDFSSPRSSADANDLLFMPNAIGRSIGLEATRQVKSIPLAGKVERLFGKIMNGRFSDHLYLLASRG